VIDLRTKHERSAEGSFDGTAHGIRTEHHPLLNQVWDFAELTRGAERGFLRNRYVQMLTERGDVLGAVVRRIATHAHGRPPSGLLFHCSAGKDRTGVVAALVLLALGVPEHIVLHDYARSEEAMRALVAWYEGRERPVAPDARGLGPADRAAAMALMTAAPAILEGALATVARRHGSIAGYLDAIGVDDATVQHLRASYLESSVPEPRATPVPA
jgi:protein-tyrosine phosphatase